jgi:hypothetical protein
LRWKLESDFQPAGYSRAETKAARWFRRGRSDFNTSWLFFRGDFVEAADVPLRIKRQSDLLNETELRFQKVDMLFFIRGEVFKENPRYPVID